MPGQEDNQNKQEESVGERIERDHESILKGAKELLHRFGNKNPTKEELRMAIFLGCCLESENY